MRFSLLEILRDWQPLRLDALGLITLLGAEEVAKAAGSLTPNVLTDYLPLLGANKIASNQFAQVEPGFALYNITDGIWITEVQAWFTRWLWMNIHSNYVILKWTHSRQPRKSYPHHVQSLLIGMVFNFGLIAFTMLQADWYGFANAVAMFVSVLVRAYVRSVMLSRLDSSFSRGEKNIQDHSDDPSLAKFIIAFPDGKLAIFRCERDYLSVMVDDKKPIRLLIRIMLRIARGYGWLAFAVQIVFMGQAALSTQIIMVVVMVLASLLTVCHVGERRQGQIGSYIQIKQQPIRAKGRLDVYAELLPTSEEERYMTKRGLLPDKKSLWGADWWVRWHEARTRIDAKTDGEKRRILNIPHLDVEALATDSSATLFEDDLETDLLVSLFTERLRSDLLARLEATQLDQRAMKTLSSVLPILIQAFAAMSTRGSNTQLSKEFLISIYRFPGVFQELLCEEIMSGSKKSISAHPSKSQQGHVIHVKASGRSHPDIESITATYGYRWLLQRLSVMLKLVWTGSNILDIFQRDIALLLPSQLDFPPITKIVLYKLDWNLKAFLESREYGLDSSLALEKVITFTGSSQDAQALTLAQYLSQTWPMTGGITLQLLRDILNVPQGVRVKGQFGDETKIEASFDAPYFQCQVSGTVATIIEIGEQLSWLGAALRESPRDEGLVYSTPVVANSTSEQQSCPTTQSGLQFDALFSMKFSVEHAPKPLPYSPGCCWHKLLKNPVVVNGYPIPCRDQSQTGLEIPLTLMVNYLGARSVDRYGEKICIKGFNSMLLPVKLSKDVLFWHLIYNEDRSRISYLKNTLPPIQNLQLNDLERFRHVVGWCSDAKFYAGSAQAKHPVDKSGLPPVAEDSPFGRTSIYAGRSVPGHASFLISPKDIPRHIVRDGYIPKLKWISKKYILLWDESNKRGWLTTGINVLLHLVRASLNHDSTDKFKAAFMFNNKELNESPLPLTADAAVHVLIDQENRRLKIYPEKEGFIMFEDRIEVIYNMLEKIIDHQTEFAEVCSELLHNHPRSKLEGWDFWDLATLCDTLHPRVAALDPGGKCWVDLIRSIPAVALFGRDFGELILPGKRLPCEYWTQLPRNEFYLAAGLSDLEHIIETEAQDSLKNPTKIGKNTIWYNPSTSNTRLCRCGGIGCNPVQTLLPNSFHGILPSKGKYMPFQKSWAVIFGESADFPLIWNDDGPPRKKRPPVPRRLAVYPSATAQSTRHKTLSAEKYTVAILCALPKELMAVRMMFERTYADPSLTGDDAKHYTYGQIGDHNIVATSLPDGEYGTNAAANSAANMKRSFPSIRFCFLVGIGGGVPSAQHDIRLGDVVVSLPTGGQLGVVQYDMGKSQDGAFQCTTSLDQPPRCLTIAISHLRSNPGLPPDPLASSLESMARHRPEYGHPGQHNDPNTCSQCHAENACADGVGHAGKKKPRPSGHPVIHYGCIASGNRVIKDATERDLLAKVHDVLCFEMEAAGVMNTFKTLVIRGVCDYADNSKNKMWQEYAAATAAAYVKLLLSYIQGSDDLGTTVW